jgi:hypothetical protein
VPKVSSLVLLTKNLMDASKVHEIVPGATVARDLGDESLVDADLILLDLTSGLEPADVAVLGPPVIAYGPHVDSEGLEAARAAGCRDALPRSQVFSRLRELVVEVKDGPPRSGVE